MTEFILAIVAVLGWLPYGTHRFNQAIHILQLEEYQTGRYLRWSYGAIDRLIDGSFVTGSVAVIALAAADWFVGGLPLIEIAVSAWAAVCLVRWWRRDRTPAKKPMTWTARAKRLAGLTGLVVVLLLTLAWPFGVLAVLIVLALAATLARPIILAAANLIAQPIEAGVRRYYLENARRKVRELKPLVIGVTGSYGKTTTKEILAAFCQQAGPTLKPPGSTNTLMGVTRQINERLQPGDRFFVCEMGDYVRGDIRDLCRLVGPRIGVLTTIGPEHLERFGSMENVILAKQELIDALPADGVMILNTDSPEVRALADATTRVRTIRVGLDPAGSPDITAVRPTTSAEGVAFELVRPGRPPLCIESRLLGRHNVNNLLIGLAVAGEIGLGDDAIRRAVAGITTPDHRLQVLRTPGGATIIDDAYNANPVGVANALEVLRDVPARKRVLVTPGMVELGPVEYEANHRFGEQAAEVCDTVILVGPKRTAPIAAGLRAAGFPQDRIVVVSGLAEVTDWLKVNVTADDVVLFCNDLPDQYSE